jgi:hypothetical protein
VLYGQQVRDNCIDHLKLAKNISLVGSTRPFFIGCGFHKVGGPSFPTNTWSTVLYCAVRFESFASSHLLALLEILWTRLDL